MSARDATQQFPQCPTVIQSETCVSSQIMALLSLCRGTRDLKHHFRVTRLLVNKLSRRTRLQLEEDRQPCDGYLENALFMVIPNIIKL